MIKKSGLGRKLGKVETKTTKKGVKVPVKVGSKKVK